MGCSQSHLCVATLSQQDARALLQQQQLQQQLAQQPSQPAAVAAQQQQPLAKQRNVKLPLVREFAADPGKAAQSAADKQQAVAAAEAMLAANAGASHRDTYVRATLVSYGGSCRVFTAVNKHTNEHVAIKTITKSAKAPEVQRGRVLQEMGAMLRLQHHPHAVRLLDAYEDGRAYHLIMPLLKGGELFEHIGSRAALTEAMAASIARSLLQYLAHIHGLGVAHMDIKPENIMFDCQGAHGVLKVIDLGSAEFVAVGQEVPHAFGTVRYSSPEMAAHSAGPASDVWSAGVVLCHVLTGRVPFLKDKDLDTLEYIRKGPEVKFSGATWRQVSAAAKDCIRAMLAPDPEARPSAADLLRHPWLAASAPTTPLSASILHQLQLFAGLSRARRVMLGVAAKALSGPEASRLLKAFLAVDEDFNGTLEFNELAVAAKQAEPDLSEAELQRVFAALDVDNTGSIDAQEFFAGVLHVALLPQATHNVLEASFRLLDRARKGHLTQADLAEGLRIASPSAFNELTRAGSLESELAEEFAAMDANGDGVISFEEYKSALSQRSAAAAAAAAAQQQQQRQGVVPQQQQQAPQQQQQPPPPSVVAAH